MTFSFKATLCAVALSSTLSMAQRPGEVSVPEQVGPEAQMPGIPTLASGPKVYLAEAQCRLVTMDLGNGSVRFIGNMGVCMTDIAFCPGGTLYGTSFTKLYRINPNTAQATLIGDNTVGDLNALVCTKSGQLLSMGYRHTNLYRMDRNTGRATSIGNTGFKSAGDLAFHEGFLWMTSTDKKLVKLNPATGAPQAVYVHNLVHAFGLGSLGPTKLYVFALTTAYKFVENANGPTGATTKLFRGLGLGEIGGAAVNGPF